MDRFGFKKIAKLLTPGPGRAKLRPRVGAAVSFAWILGALIQWQNARAEGMALTGRYSQGTVTYASSDADSLFSGTASATVDLLGLNLSFGGAADAKQRKSQRLHGFLDLELVRQVVAGVQYYNPRVSGRLAFGRDLEETDRFGVSAFLQLQFTQSPLLLVQGPTDIRQQTIQRKGFGMGMEIGIPIARHSASRDGRFGKIFNLSGLLYGLGRFELPETASILPTRLNPGLSYEAGASATLKLHVIRLQIRGRLLGDLFTWQASDGSGVSQLKNQYILVDFGVGIPF